MSDVRVARATWSRALVAAFVGAGIVLRIVILLGRTGVLDSDEAVVGLMARLGLAFLLVVLELVDRPTWWLGWVALGTLAGLGWWTSPQILYFVVAGLAWLAFRLRRGIVRLAVALPAAIVGAAPWLVWNAHND